MLRREVGVVPKKVEPVESPNYDDKRAIRAMTWNPEVEDAYRFQLAGYRDEDEYVWIRPEMKIERWANTGFVKKLQCKNDHFYYYDESRECPDERVTQVRLYSLKAKSKTKGSATNGVNCQMQVM